MPTTNQRLEEIRRYYTEVRPPNDVWAEEEWEMARYLLACVDALTKVAEAAEKVIEAASSDVFWDTVAHPEVVHKRFLEARAAWQQVKEEQP